MAEAPDTLRAQQFALSRHLRDPGAAPAPAGIEARRLGIYRDLFYNNLQGLLAGNFPVIRQTLGDADWHALVRAFYAGHRCRTPLFTEIGREFVRWLEARIDQDTLLPPWLPELAHYEWVELALQISDATAPGDVGIDPGEDAAMALLAGIPVPSPWAWALAYRWPVHRIGPDHRPALPPDQPTLILARRDAGGEVRFAQLSPLVFRLLELLGDGNRSGRDCLLVLAAEAGAGDAGAFVAEGGAMLARMLAEGSLLGVRRA
ncbi:MAG: putative DNA-binding domain-containing protein [Luteimonas sp.]|nr:putative DNA-binding domain-containing protein [Luteimonas sp.]